MNNHRSRATFVVLAIAVAAVFISSIVLVASQAKPKKKLAEELVSPTGRTRVPIAISGNNVYLAW
jgi:hypothetical protein